MWPKMLFELLPHLARLVPVADKFFNSRSASDTAQQTALAALAADMRGDLGQVTEAHSALAAHLVEQNRQLSRIAAEATQTRTAVDSIEARITRMEGRADAIVRLLAVVLLMLSSGLVMLAMLLHVRR